MKKASKILAVILSLAMVFSVFGVGATASDGSAPKDLRFAKTLSKVVTDVLQGIIGGVSLMFRDPGLAKKSEYTHTPVFEGTGGFATEPTADKWLAGYGSASLIPDDLDTGGYHLAGSFGWFKGNIANGSTTDQRIYVEALDAGDGWVLFCAMDGFAITEPTTDRVRAAVKEAFDGTDAEIKAVNITCTHTHHALDFCGLGDGLSNLFSYNILHFGSSKGYDSVDARLLEILKTKTVESAKTAIESARYGELYYGAADASDILYDKQKPIVFDPNINVIKFVPDDGSSEIWLINAGVHPTTIDRSTMDVSADFPGYMVDYAKETYGADVAFYQGAQAAMTKDTGPLGIPAGADDYEVARVYAHELVDRAASVDIGSAERVAPILNMAYGYTQSKVTNNIMVLGGKLRLINSNFCKEKLSYYVCTEVGYCELGDNIAIALIPGEMSPEIMYGGVASAEESWSGEGWEYPAINTLVGGRKLLCFGLTNDELGYIVPDNDFAPEFAQFFADMLGDRNKHYEEVMSCGRETASTLTQAYIDLIGSVH